MGNRVDGRSPSLAAAIMGNGVARQYRKTALVWAMPLSEEATIDTPEGQMVCRIGDYLASDDPPTHLWPVRRDIFEATYVPAKQEARAEPEALLRAAIARVRADIDEDTGSQKWRNGGHYALDLLESELLLTVLAAVSEQGAE